MPPSQPPPSSRHGAALRYVPPPAESQVRAKSLRLDDSPRARLDRCRILAAELFAQMLAERGVPNTEIGQAIGVSERCVRDFRSLEHGRKPIGVRHVLAMPRRLALVYLDLVRCAVLNDNIGGHE